MGAKSFDLVVSYTPEELRRLADAMEAKAAGLPIYMVTGEVRNRWSGDLILGCKYDIERACDLAKPEAPQ